MQTQGARKLVLAICAHDKRLWVYDSDTGVNHPVPVTNFYNELMLHLNVRNPKIALNAQRLFVNLAEFSDGDLFRAFRSYNQIRTKVNIDSTMSIPGEKRSSFLNRMFGMFRNTQV
jgi:hypothetical protein